MKVYVAAKFQEKVEVRRLYKKLLAEGHTITHDWLNHKFIKPYHKNARLARKYATADIEGVKKADVFIMRGDEKGTGMNTELGAAILSNIAFGRPIIYVIVKGETPNAFYYHPSVNLVKNEADALSRIRDLSE